jgi:hypothetical protein
MKLSALLPTRKKTKIVGVVYPLKKPCHCPSCGLQAVIVLLTGCGSKGEDDGNLTVIGYCRWLMEPLEFVLPMGVP